MVAASCLKEELICSSLFVIAALLIVYHDFHPHQLFM